MIELKNAAKRFGDKALFSGLNLKIREGERLCLSGESGSGKTTLLRVIMGLETLDEGTLTLSEDTVFSVQFQEDRLLEWKTALGNLTAVGIEEGRARELLSLAELSGAENKYPRQLSGGMKRRLSLVRALGYVGNTVILDEPFQGLDEALKERIEKLIDSQTQGRTLIMVSHERVGFAVSNLRTLRF